MIYINKNKKREEKKMNKLIELKMFVAKEKAKFSKNCSILNLKMKQSTLMTIIKIKAEKEFGILFVQKNWEAI